MVLDLEFKRLASIAKKKKLKIAVKVAVAICAFSVLSLAVQSVTSHLTLFSWLWFGGAPLDGLLSTAVAFFLFRVLRG